MRRNEGLAGQGFWLGGELWDTLFGLSLQSGPLSWGPLTVHHLVQACKAPESLRLTILVVTQMQGRRWPKSQAAQLILACWGPTADDSGASEEAPAVPALFKALSSPACLDLLF